VTLRALYAIHRIVFSPPSPTKEDHMSLLSQVAQTATTPANSIGLPEVGGAAGALTAGLYLLDRWMSYRSAGREVASQETKEERGHIAEWASKLLTADMEARKEDGADRRAMTAALAGLERQMALQTEALRQIQSDIAASKQALTSRKSLVALLDEHAPGTTPP